MGGLDEEGKCAVVLVRELLWWNEWWMDGWMDGWVNG